MNLRIVMNYDFVPISTRKPLKWPNGARVALILTINVEYWDLLKDTENLITREVRRSCLIPCRATCPIIPITLGGNTASVLVYGG